MSATHTQRIGVRSLPVRQVDAAAADAAAAFSSVAWSLSRIDFLSSLVLFLIFFFFFGFTIKSVNMGKKEEEEIIRIAKKMDKMAQKKNGVRRMMNAEPLQPDSGWC